MQNTKELNTIQLQKITGGGNVKQCGAGILGGVIAGSTGGPIGQFLGAVGGGIAAGCLSK
ncbi:Blp family class II bacteriocin [Enterococcus faecalis]|jgi:outer membrane lipoprotein SlyB|uniref:Blp family class II bacteriocin n=1 Tax=Enterococcus faecalis TaxID=1351 RepID=UPI00192721FE|nr:Blp family class II bacteriocin [Enterococcus faecalis]MCO5446217.1 Blp family class II bacteriocin [Enterococcus faecalis]